MWRRREECGKLEDRTEQAISVFSTLTFCQESKKKKFSYSPRNETLNRCTFHSVQKYRRRRAFDVFGSVGGRNTKTTRVNYSLKFFFFTKRLYLSTPTTSLLKLRWKIAISPRYFFPRWLRVPNILVDNTNSGLHVVSNSEHESGWALSVYHELWEDHTARVKISKTRCFRPVFANRDNTTTT